MKTVILSTIILAFVPIIVNSQKYQTENQEIKEISVKKSMFLNAPPQYRKTMGQGRGQWLWSTWPIWNREDLLDTSMQTNSPISTTSTISNLPIMLEKLVNKCREMQTEYKGKCFGVLQQLPCPDGQWLIEDPLTKQGKCVENKCYKSPNTGSYKDQCVAIKSEEFCPKGMRTYIYKSGIVNCDCKEGYIFNEVDGNCYEAYRQGPCKRGEYFGFSDATIKSSKNESPKPKCLLNSCQIDGYFCNDEKNCGLYKQYPYWTKGYKGSPKVIPSTCVKFGSACGENNTGIFTLNFETNQPYCQKDGQILKAGDITTRIIGNVPTFKCAPGSRRDILGNCREPTVIEFS